MKKQITALVALVGFSFFSSAQAAVIYDESISGDLSSDNLNPTSLMLTNGSNSIIGSVVNSPIDRDFFTVTIGTNQTLDAIVLEQYDTTEDQSFFAVQSGSAVTSLTNPAALLGSSLIGAGAGSQVGNNVLDNLGTAPFGGTGFSGPLGAGTYTFWFQETSAAVDYTFNLQVVPVPAALWLMLSGLAGLAAFRKR